MRRTDALLAALVASLVLACPAAAFAPPELFVRAQRWDTHEETGAWLPLASAPTLDYLGGYEIGIRLQASGAPFERQRVALTIAGVPDGTPTQPGREPYCGIHAGTVGTIVAAGPELQFEGTGAYTVRVSLGPESGDEDDCLTTGEATTGTFTVDTRVAPERVGDPMTFRSVPLPRGQFVGIRAADPPGGAADLRCGLDATVQPDGSLAGPLIFPAPDYGGPYPEAPELAFERPGAWTCVARGTAEGQDDNRDLVTFGTPWSAPLAFDVRSDFRRRTGTVKHRRARRPRFAFTAEWPAESQGGRAGLTVSRVTGCKGRRYKQRKVSTTRGTFGPKRLRLAVRRPRRGFYLGRLGFEGTRFVRPGVDPAPLLLLARHGAFGFVPAREFPRCT